MRQANLSSACYHRHSHDEFSFGVIDIGSAQYKNLNNINTVGQGDTVFINPGNVHSCNPGLKDWLLPLSNTKVFYMNREIC